MTRLIAWSWLVVYASDTGCDRTACLCGVPVRPAHAGNEGVVEGTIRKTRLWPWLGNGSRFAADTPPSGMGANWVRGPIYRMLADEPSQWVDGYPNA